MMSIVDFCHHSYWRCHKKTWKMVRPEYSALKHSSTASHAGILGSFWFQGLTSPKSEKNDCILWFHLQQLQSLHQNITSPQCYATHLDCCLFSLQFLHLAHKMSYKSPEQKWNFTTPSLKSHLKKNEAFKQKASKHSKKLQRVFEATTLVREPPTSTVNLMASAAALVLK